MCPMQTLPRFSTGITCRRHAKPSGHPGEPQLPQRWLPAEVGHWLSIGFISTNILKHGPSNVTQQLFVLSQLRVRHDFENGLPKSAFRKGLL
jgi:hypothetical protein